MLVSILKLSILNAIVLQTKSWALFLSTKDSTFDIPYPNNWSIAEVGREELYVDGGRHEDEFEVSPSIHESTQYSKEEVSMQVTLMDLIHDDHTVPT